MWYHYPVSFPTITLISLSLNYVSWKEDIDYSFKGSIGGWRDWITGRGLALHVTNPNYIPNTIYGLLNFAGSDPCGRNKINCLSTANCGLNAKIKKFTVLTSKSPQIRAELEYTRRVVFIRLWFFSRNFHFLNNCWWNHDHHLIIQVCNGKETARDCKCGWNAWSEMTCLCVVMNGLSHDKREAWTDDSRKSGIINYFCIVKHLKT